MATIRAKETAAKPAGKPAGGTVEKLKEFGKKVGEKAKTAVAGIQAVGTVTKSLVSRNGAASIAGSLGTAAGMADLNRNKQAQSKG